ncbi:MAG: MFS transporter [Desulfurococcales archaeon]|nr:MFS transporter [Desulfurococcales archaeon]
MRPSTLDTIRAGLPAFTYFYTVGSIGFWISLYAKELQWGYTLINLLATVYFIALTPSNIVAGILADITGRPGLLLTLGMAGNGVTSLLMPHTEHPITLLALRAFQGISLATSLPLALGSLSILYGVRGGVAITVLFTGSGMASGALAGGLLVQYFGFTHLFYSTALISFVASLLSLGWEPPPLERPRSITESLKKMPPSYIAVITALAMRNTFSSGVFAIVSIYFTKHVGLDSHVTGLALALNPVTQAITSLLVSRYISGRELIYYSLGLSMTSIVFTLYYIANDPITVLTAQLLLGASFGTVMVSGNMYLISNAPRELRYTASSLFSFAFNLGWILGTVIAGPYMDVHTPESWIKVAIIGTLASGIVGITPLIARR